MKKLIFGLCVIGFIVCVFGSVYAEKAVITKLVGNKAYFQLPTSTKWYRCHEGMILGENTTIKTDTGVKLEMVLEDGSKIVIGPKSLFILKEMTPTSKLFQQDKGKLRVYAKKILGDRKFSVYTPTAVCSIRGTEFSINVGDNNETLLKVFSGIVDVKSLTQLGEEVLVSQNQKLEILMNQPISEPVIMTPKEQKEEFNESIKKQEEISGVYNEVRMDMSKEDVQKAAAEEKRLAEYQEGKSIIDAFGLRVRIEEYIVRPQPDKFKMVVLNERESRFDYFTWLATFNKALPTDLTLATKNINWRGGDGTPVPDYWLKATESYASNTVDGIEWGYTGGHIVNSGGIDSLLFNNYYFRTRVGGVSSDKITYQPKSGVTNISGPSDIEYYINGTKIADLATWWNSHIVETASGYEMKDDAGKIVYKENYYIIDDNGKQATQKDINNMYDVSDGNFIKDQLYKWNFENVYWSDDFKGPDKKIDVAVSPKMFVDAGLLQAK